jgi:hypothetical protein
MAKVGHILISGIIWIVIAIGIGGLGFWMTRWGGLWCVSGWAMVIVCGGFVGITASQLCSLIWLSMKSLRMMRHHPEEYARLKTQFDDAMRRIEDEG